MFGLTPLGILHTAISLVAVASGAIAIIAHRKISWDNTVGKIYVVSTIITCVTGFGIFQHGGFGKAHLLGAVTLLVLAIAFAAREKNRVFGSSSPYIETVSYSATFFFHLVPGITETSTRLPRAAPLASGPQDPRIQLAIGVCFILFLIGSAMQVRMISADLRNPKHSADGASGPRP